jgi:hypothetical protein
MMDLHHSYYSRPKLSFFTSALLVHCILAYALAFIPPSAVKTRAMVFIMVVPLVLPLYSLAPYIGGNRIPTAVAVYAMWIQLLKSVDTLFLNPQYHHPSPAGKVATRKKSTLNGSATEERSGTRRKGDNTSSEEPALPRMSLWARYLAAWKSLWDMRGIRTKPPTQNIPASDCSKHSQMSSSRLKFLLHRCAKFVFKYLILEVLAISPPPKPEDFAAAKEPFFSRLRSINGEELAIRIFSTVGFWVNMYLFISVLYDVLTVFHVGLGIDPPHAWPPAFGNISEAYSVRQFWGYVLFSFQYPVFIAGQFESFLSFPLSSFHSYQRTQRKIIDRPRKTWHQTLRQLLTANANFFASSILHIPEGTLLSRYSKILFAFVISGSLHFMTDTIVGVSSTESGAVTFFAIQAVTVMLEDGVQELWRRWEGQSWGRTGEGVKLGGRYNRAFGYVWVILFAIWSSPRWSYPAARCVRPGKDVMLPYRILG